MADTNHPFDRAPGAGDARGAAQIRAPAGAPVGSGAGNGTRTRECQLGKLMPYHLAMPALVRLDFQRGVEYTLSPQGEATVPQPMRELLHNPRQRALSKPLLGFTGNIGATLIPLLGYLALDVGLHRPRSNTYRILPVVAWRLCGDGFLWDKDRPHGCGGLPQLRRQKSHWASGPVKARGSCASASRKRRRVASCP